MAKLSGWKKLGIIASVAWILAAWVRTFDSQMATSEPAINSRQIKCDADLAGRIGDDWKKGFDECNEYADESLKQAMAIARFDAAIVAFVPVPMGWALTYLVLFLVRWVKRGFEHPL